MNIHRTTGKEFGFRCAKSSVSSSRMTPKDCFASAFLGMSQTLSRVILELADHCIKNLFVATANS